MKPIALLVNSEDMLSTVKDAIANTSAENDVESIMTHTYEESFKIAQDFKANGGQCIIARGGHARFLRAMNTELSITAIPFTGNNIASMLIRATKDWGEFAVIGNITMVQIARELERPIGAKIHYFEITNWADFDTIMLQLRGAGVKAVVGGYDATRAARAFGIHDYCIRTCEIEIVSAIIEAKGVLSALMRDQHWNKLFGAAIDTIGEGVVVFDGMGTISHANQRAIKMLGENGVLTKLPLAAMQSHKDKALSSGEPVYDELYENNGYKFTASFLPIEGQENSLVTVMQEVEYVHKIERKIRQKIASKGLIAKNSFESICEDSPAVKKAVEIAKRYAVVNSSVLITGETGTGKEMFAQSIHNYSKRADEAFVAVNCATIPANLLESELFGYVEGAFTGAKRGGKIGLFELAHKGTIFLDEIGETSLDLQARLLRVLEEHEIMRVGDDKVIPIDIRVIAATNRDLKEMVNEGKFRSDFYYRLDVLSLRLPPLHECKENIETLTRNFTNKYAALNKRRVLRYSDDAIKILRNYSWPGNVRELKNVIERLVVTSSKEQVEPEQVIEALHISVSPENTMQKNDPGTLSAAETEMIRRTLDECGGNKTLAAKKLGISRPTLHRKLKLLEDEDI
ncbi:MAG: sigma 54-interacting transcriptional regulator [Firmicutes bacterium]|nr:sigma 54-interacting transcriptional regulator [Bacillota bacterium]